MLDTAIKMIFVLLSAPLWMPILRSLREQFQEVFEQETPAGDPRSWNVIPDDAGLPTHNAELVDEPLAAVRSRTSGFASATTAADGESDGTGSSTRKLPSLRRAS